MVIIEKITTDALVFNDSYDLSNTHPKKCTEIRHWSHWIFASVSHHFGTFIETAGYTFFIEGTDRDYGEQTYIEFRMNGPNLTRLNRNYYKLDVNINLMWSHNQDHNDLYVPARIRGLLIRAMRDICIYRYGDDQTLLGILKLKHNKQNATNVNNFAQVRPDVKLLQGTVEGTFEMHLTCE